MERASQATTQPPGTMPPPTAPTQTVAAPVPPAVQQPTRGAVRSMSAPTPAIQPAQHRPGGEARAGGPSARPATEDSTRVVFNAQMSDKNIIWGLKQLLPEGFGEPPEVAAEFKQRGIYPWRRMRKGRS
jgi:hypothetical protein